LMMTPLSSTRSITSTRELAESSRNACIAITSPSAGRLFLSDPCHLFFACDGTHRFASPEKPPA
ncbi:MAG: hypothetical protein PHF57_09975, partial [Methanoregula sp.]|nr:hypothetical protein [Methanoregula sp.]